MSSRSLLLSEGGSDPGRSMFVTDFEGDDTGFIATISAMEPNVERFLERNRLAIEKRKGYAGERFLDVAEACARSQWPIIVWNWWHHFTEQGMSPLFSEGPFVFPDLTDSQGRIIAEGDRSLFGACGAAPVSEEVVYGINSYFLGRQRQLQEGSLGMNPRSRR